MVLDRAGLADREAWTKKGYELPEYDLDVMIKQTKEEPFWIHFGAGNIFRAFQANVVQKLLNKGVLNRGLIVTEGYDYEIIQKMYAPHDNLSVLVTLKADGQIQKTVIGSIAESLCLDRESKEEFDRLREIFRADSLQMATFTITEKGYSLIDGKGEILDQIKSDFAKGPQHAVSYIGKVASLLFERYSAGKKPIAMVSMDNCSHNGEKLYQAIFGFAKAWVENGQVEKEFLDYVNDPSMVSFPFTMIDKITPRPDDSVCKRLQQDQVEALLPIVTSKNTYVAPFVNAEECEYLVIEDLFPNGRPKLEAGGLMLTDRETVERVERMKVCTCLNPLHTALAVFGCLLGYDLISKEMKDPALKALVEKIGYDEGLLVVTDPKIIEPRRFIDEVLQTRIPNPFMPDTPQRIATDTSQKLAIRFGETIKAYQLSDHLKVSDLKFIPLVFAAWLRYLMAVDDQGNSFTLSPDPMLLVVCPYLADVRLGEDFSVHETVKPILENEEIFAVDLFKVGMGEKVEHLFYEMTRETGAVRKVLERELCISH
ncbi:MAG: mannitol dehydrogenase family protein [Clostridia bacterium]|nr:mannitol dehydrogenase family protein [Clostridia bacterium]